MYSSFWGLDQGDNIYEKLRFWKWLLSLLPYKIKYGFIHTVGKPQLSSIGKFYGTDKADGYHSFKGQSYLNIYEKYFHKFQDKNASILEIGVKDGASLKVWESYFKKGRVYGIDIDPNCKRLETERSKIEIGSQDDADFLNTCFGRKTNFDIIIDDGSHINNFTIFSFECLFNNRLKSGGIYIIEDLRCSYEKLQSTHNVLKTWPGMKYNDPSKSYDNNRKDIEDFFLEKIKKLDHSQGNIMYLHFWSMTCVIVKV